MAARIFLADSHPGNHIFLSAGNSGNRRKLNCLHACHTGKNLLCQRAALCRSAHHPRVGQNHPHSNGHQRKREEEHPCARVPLPAAPHRTAGRLLFSVNCHLFFLTTLWRPRIRLAVCVLPCRMRFCLIFKATPHNSRLTA